MGSVCGKPASNEIHSEVDGNKCFNLKRFKSSCCDGSVLCCVTITKDQLAEIHNQKRQDTPRPNAHTN